MPEAKKIAESINFEAGELRGDTDVVFLTKDYINSLLTSGKLSVWAVVAEGTDVHLTVPAKIKVTVTANPLD